jgi:hypothetical protein
MPETSSSAQWTRTRTRTRTRARGKVDVVLGAQRAKAAALMMLALPGSVYLYQGEELGLPEVQELPDEARQDPIWERSDHREYGRDGARVPLPWNESGPSYGSSARFRVQSGIQRLNLAAPGCRSLRGSASTRSVHSRIDQIRSSRSIRTPCGIDAESMPPSPCNGSTPDATTCWRLSVEIWSRSRSSLASPTPHHRTGAGRCAAAIQATQR